MVSIRTRGCFDPNDQDLQTPHHALWPRSWAAEVRPCCFGNSRGAAVADAAAPAFAAQSPRDA